MHLYVTWEILEFCTRRIELSLESDLLYCLAIPQRVQIAQNLLLFLKLLLTTMNGIIPSFGKVTSFKYIKHLSYQINTLYIYAPEALWQACQPSQVASYSRQVPSWARTPRHAVWWLADASTGRLRGSARTRSGCEEERWPVPGSARTVETGSSSHCRCRCRKCQRQPSAPAHVVVRSEWPGVGRLTRARARPQCPSPRAIVTAPMPPPR